MKKLSLLCAALLLSACSSGNSSFEFPPPPGGGGDTPPPPPAAVIDAFYTMVTQYLNPTSEDTEATPIDSVVATQPEDTEPTEFS